ncbi:hypothetical protein Tco_0217317 [Tanacetum coccineum]
MHLIMGSFMLKSCAIPQDDLRDQSDRALAVPLSLLEKRIFDNAARLWSRNIISIHPYGGFTISGIPVLRTLLLMSGLEADGCVNQSFSRGYFVEMQNLDLCLAFGYQKFSKQLLVSFLFRTLIEVRVSRVIVCSLVCGDSRLKHETDLHKEIGGLNSEYQRVWPWFSNERRLWFLIVGSLSLVCSWTNGGGWMSLVLGSSVSFVTSISFSTTGGGIGGPSYEIPLRVVIALASFIGFRMVLLGKELQLEAWLDSSEGSVRTPTGRVILFGTIPTTILDTTPVIIPPTTQTDTTVIPIETPIIAHTIPPSLDYTPTSPGYSHASDSESDPSKNPSLDHIPQLPATSLFLSSDDDTTNSDSPDTPPSPTHGTPFTEITSSTQRSPVIPRRRVMILAPGQPIPHGRPYRYHLNGPVHMMTARKRVGPLPTHRLAVRHSADHSSSDSLSEASSDFYSDASSDSSSRHSLSDHSSPDLPSTSARPSRKRRRSPMASVPALPLVSGALSPVRADLIPSPKRVRDSGYSADVEVDPRETSLRDDVIVRGNEEPHLEQDIDPEIQAEIDECFAYADALRDRGIDARFVVEAVDREESETGARGPVEVRVERVTHHVMPEDIPEPAQEGAVEVTYETLIDLVQRFHDHTQAIPVHRIHVIEGVQREQGHRIVGVESAVTALTKRIAELERDNKRLRGTASVESQRVDRLQRGMSRMQRELRQIRRLRFYDRVRVGRLEACARKHMGYRP